MQFDPTAAAMIENNVVPQRRQLVLVDVKDLSGTRFKHIEDALDRSISSRSPDENHVRCAFK
jgi:hypothetical protein